jgi:LexA DNA binding domain
MRGLRADMTAITNRVAGKSVSRVEQPDPRHLEVHFTDDSVLAIALLHGHLAAALACGHGNATSDRRHNGPQPTRRQREYLEFIARYIRRYGISPAESDIGRHFLVSAPSVNQMVQMLERQGFIARQRGVPRSITIVDHQQHLGRPNEAGVAGGLRPKNALHRRGARVARAGR